MSRILKKLAQLGSALVVALLLSACMTVVPMELPPEGTTATVNSEGKQTKRRPDGAVTEVTETQFRSRITVTNKPPRYRQHGPYRGSLVLGCNRVGDVWQYLDTGYAAPHVCRPMRTTNARPRSSYRANDGRCYNIMEFMVGGLWYYTAVPGYCRPYRRY